MKPYLIAIAGGIGSGKSVVSQILKAIGYEVYDCDTEAKRIMDTEAALKQQLRDKIHANAVSPEGNINRKLISDIVFADAKKLETLNMIVHQSVLRDILKWKNSRDVRFAFVESAIVNQSGIVNIVDEVWRVDAPIEVRVERVMARNSCTRNEVIARIESQRSEEANCHNNVYHIKNDGATSLLLQIHSHLNRLAELSHC